MSKEQKKEKPMIESVKINIQGKTIELTIDEAKKLKEELSKLFAEKSANPNGPISDFAEKIKDIMEKNKKPWNPAPCPYPIWYLKD